MLTVDCQPEQGHHGLRGEEVNATRVVASVRQGERLDLQEPDACLQTREREEKREKEREREIDRERKREKERERERERERELELS